MNCGLATSGLTVNRSEPGKRAQTARPPRGRIWDVARNRSPGRGRSVVGEMYMQPIGCVLAAADMATFNKHGANSLTPIIPDSLGKFPGIIGLELGVPAKFPCELGLAIDSSADWT